MKLNNNKGFSLIELMVVVAIIGILASVAVPNMQRFMAKSRQSEVKGMLGNYYAAQQNHHGEWSFFRGSLMDIGFGIEGEVRYAVGTAAIGGPLAANLPANYVQNALQCSNTADTDCDPNGRWQHHPAFNAILAEGAAPGFINAAAGGCQAGANPNALFGNNATFVATGLGEVGATAAAVANLDTWTIDQNRNLCNNNPQID